MLGLTFAFMLQSTTLYAIVMPPTLSAADTLGYSVAGEIEFAARSPSPTSRHLLENLNAIREICPRTQVIETPVSKSTHIVVLAWSDREFPRAREIYRASDIALAEQRARGVAAVLRRELRGPTSFELVNMASRRPHKIKVNERAEIGTSEYDVKTALKEAGGAPTNPLELGLFGEYAQKSKAVVWVECSESFQPRPLAQRADSRLALMEPTYQHNFTKRRDLE